MLPYLDGPWNLTPVLPYLDGPWNLTPVLRTDPSLLGKG